VSQRADPLAALRLRCREITDTVLLPKKSFPNEGTRPLMANGVGIRRQAWRGADGCCAVDRLGRVVGAGRAVASDRGASVPLSGSQAFAGQAGVAGDLVRVAHGDRVDAPAARLGFGSGVTCWRRLDEWQKAGVWERLHVQLLSRLRAAGQIEWSRAVVDSSQIQAKRGAPRRARARSTEAVPAPSTTFSSTPAGSLSPGA
jgi:transposase